MSVNREAESLTKQLVGDGLIDPSRAREAQDRIERMMKQDYIPDGRPCHKAKNMRKASPGLRCGVSTDSDIQSGPIYCGRAADYQAEPLDHNGEPTGGVLACCRGHRRAVQDILIDTFVEEAKLEFCI